MTMKKTSLAAALGTLMAATSAYAQHADTLFVGGDILTMRGAKPEYAEALAVKDGKIAYVGKASGSLRLLGPATQVVNLSGKTLLPGFIDGHGHMIYFGKNLVDADLVNVKDIPELLAQLRKQAERMGPNDWIVGFGYAIHRLKENRHPTIEELDSVSADRPILVVDGSGHNGAGNSGVFKAMKFDANTPDPEGGSFARKADGKSLAGPLEEVALFAVREARPPFTGKLADDAAIGGARVWASFGHTTAQECGVGLGNDDVDIIRNAMDKNLLSVDLYLCAKDTLADDVIAAAQKAAKEYRAAAETPEAADRQQSLVKQAVNSSTDTMKLLLAARPDLDKRYINRVRLGGIKFWLDGSVPTAWFTQPYTTNPPDKSGSYSGFRQIPDAALNATFDKYWTTDIQINMHMNGDAAAEQALKAIELAVGKYGMRDHRPVFIHNTYMRPSQIRRAKKIGAVPTYTVGSIGAIGDLTYKLWGHDRTSFAMPGMTLTRLGMRFSLNHDAPVLPTPSVMALVDAAVNRTTSTGRTIGPKERLSPYLALRAVTAHAAFQIKEEKTKGTLEVGKLADLVVLEQNPLKIDPRTIKDVKVLETIKEGKTIFQRGQP